MILQTYWVEVCFLRILTDLLLKKTTHNVTKHCISYICLSIISLK